MGESVTIPPAGDTPRELAQIRRSSAIVGALSKVTSLALAHSKLRSEVTDSLRVMKDEMHLCSVAVQAMADRTLQIAATMPSVEEELHSIEDKQTKHGQMIVEIERKLMKVSHTALRDAAPTPDKGRRHELIHGCDNIEEEESRAATRALVEKVAGEIRALNAAITTTVR